jgi:hypothetical protein
MINPHIPVVDLEACQMDNHIHGNNIGVGRRRTFSVLSLKKVKMEKVNLDALIPREDMIVDKPLTTTIAAQPNVMNLRITDL